MTNFVFLPLSQTSSRCSISDKKNNEINLFRARLSFMDDFLQNYSFYRNQSPACQRITQADVAQIIKQKIFESQSPLDVLPLNAKMNSSLVSRIFHYRLVHLL